MKGARLKELARRRDMVTPEGIPLHLEIARAGDRAAAFLIDFLFMILLLFAVLIPLLLLGRNVGEWGMAIAMLLLFGIRSWYFIWFETRGQGRTPGKKRARIRVMDACGGPLRTDAVVVRNLMRELEVWIPLAFLIAPDQVWPGAPGWARVFFMAWALSFLLMPLFNKDRLRVGDMVAGTIVVTSPASVLLPDLGARAVQRAERQPESSTYAFTDAQIDTYGIYELQVLEDVLRRTDRGRHDAFGAVCSQIRKKIRWSGTETIKPERFLREFYTALRSRLEHKMLLGKKKKDKYS